MMDHIHIRSHEGYFIYKECKWIRLTLTTVVIAKGKHTYEILDTSFIGDTMEITVKNKSAILGLKSNVASPQSNKTK
jgi:hypothetical protein